MHEKWSQIMHNVQTSVWQIDNKSILLVRNEKTVVFVDNLLKRAVEVSFINLQGQYEPNDFKKDTVLKLHFLC